MTIRTHTLSNGFRIVTEAMPSLKSASIGVWVLAGGRHERIEQNGIAHFLEHMAFKGTTNRTALQIAEQIEDVGGYINAYTSREMTAYYARVLEEDVTLGLDIIGDILMNPVFNPHDVDVERGVILQEIGLSYDTPDDIVFDWLQEAAYPDQPLGRTILGPSERVSAFQNHDLQGFMDEHYAPDRMILSAAGAVDHDAIVKQAEAIFGGMTSRPNRGLCYSIFAQTGAYADTGMMTIYAGTSADDIAQLSQITMDEMKRAADDMSEAEVARARAQMKAGLLMGLETPSNRAERLVHMLYSKGRIIDLEETVAMIDNVSVQDVREFAGKMAGEAEMAMAIYGPGHNTPDLDTLKSRLAA
ncbi:MAG: insulinase family protein [Marivivens sp.]|nr:insulinase family protein [Marivivens sp.]